MLNRLRKMVYPFIFSINTEFDKLKKSNNGTKIPIKQKNNKKRIELCCPILCDENH